MNNSDMVILFLSISLLIDEYQIRKLEKENKELRYKLIGKE